MEEVASLKQRIVELTQASNESCAVYASEMGEKEKLLKKGEQNLKATYLLSLCFMIYTMLLCILFIIVYILLLYTLFYIVYFITIICINSMCRC